ncbi:MAG: hypothetical protein K9L74_03240 [Candidatus Izimaplasma sp.]|nr:hypothetical protein [Candidatus Izimaplasma bacterium]
MKVSFKIGVILLSLLLVSCVSFSTILDNFEAEGYTYSTDSSDWIGNVLTRFDEENLDVQSHVFYSGIDVAIVLEFNSSSELKDQMDTNEDLQELIDNLEERKLIRGNFLLIPMSFSSDTKESMIEIFNR